MQILLNKAGELMAARDLAGVESVAAPPSRVGRIDATASAVDVTPRMTAITGTPATTRLWAGVGAGT